MSLEVAAAASERAREHALEAGSPPHTADDRGREENLSVATSSFAAVATAWAAFQVATWSSRQTFLIAHGIRQRALSTEARLEGDQQLHLDADLFVAWARAETEHNAALSQFLHDRFPPRLKAATDAWLATKPLVTKDAPPAPFYMPAYQLEAHQRAIVLGKEADDDIDRGRAANHRSDTYVFVTVFLAMIILLSSLSLRMRNRGPRRALLLVSGIGLLGVLAWLSLQPTAWFGE